MAHKTNATDAHGAELADTSAMRDLCGEPAHLIRRTQQIAAALFVEELGPIELTSVQFAILMTIRTYPGVEAARVSQLIAFDRSTLGEVLDRLVGKALVDRRPSEVDRRAKTLWLTPAGAALLDRAIPAVARVQERVLAPLPDADRARYIEIMRKLVGVHTGEARYGG